MYKAKTSKDWKEYFKLPVEYKIDGFISYGSWDVEKYFKVFESIIRDMKSDVEIKKLQGFLSNIFEIKFSDKIYWLTVSYGGVQLSEYVHLACMFGSKKNIHIGSCGGLYYGANSMDWLIPIYSYGNESTTRIYGKDSENNKHFPDKNLSEIIKSKIPKNKKFFEGPVITCMAMMGETFDDIKKWEKEGYYGVEMETSTVFSVSKHFDVPAASLLYVSDNLIKGQTVGDESHISQKSARDEMTKDLYRVGIESLLKI
ncbi:MAG: hypothetical protein AAB484_00335 [Patescibacteria group bacterium]